MQYIVSRYNYKSITKCLKSMNVGTDHKLRRCGSDDCVCFGGAARLAGLVSACPAARGGRGAAGAGVCGLLLPRPAPPARPPPSARTSAPLPPRHAAWPPRRPPRARYTNAPHNFELILHARLNSQRNRYSSTTDTSALATARAHYVPVLPFAAQC